jgi:hypothetical protein
MKFEYCPFKDSPPKGKAGRMIGYMIPLFGSEFYFQLKRISFRQVFQAEGVESSISMGKFSKKNNS